MQKQNFTSKKQIYSTKLTVFDCFLKKKDFFFLSILQDIFYSVNFIAKVKLLK